MSKFEFQVTKYSDKGVEEWTDLISIRAHEKLDAFAKMSVLFPNPEYKYSFIGTC